MKLLLQIIFLIVIGIYCYQFVQLMLKMQQGVVLPITEEDRMTIRKYPQKIVDLPIYSSHKRGITLFIIMLLYLIVMYIIGALNKNIEWPFYLLLFLPLTHSHNLLNLFAITEDGVISGSSFVPWKKIKSFHFVPINANHKFYGYSKEVNDGYELRIKGKFFSINCIVTTNEMKEKVSKILLENMDVKSKVLKINEC